MTWTIRGKMYFIIFGFSVISFLFIIMTVLRLSGYKDMRRSMEFQHLEINVPSLQLPNNTEANNRSIKAKYDAEYESICRGDWQENYRKIHQNNIETWRKFLVFRCSRGGWGNRLRALLSSFILAVMSKRAFIIDCMAPSPLEKYLAPNFIKWNYKIDTKGLSVRFRNPRNDEICKSWENSDFVTCMNYSVEGIHNNNRPFYTGLIRNPNYNLPRWKNDFQLLGCSFHFLFKKSEYLMNSLKKARESLGCNGNIVLGIHIRRGDTDKDDARLAKTEDAQYHFDCAGKIEQRIQEKYNTTNVIWFLATDSVEVKQFAKRKYPDKIRQLYGPIEHVGHPKKGNEDAGHLSMFLDYFLLQQSDFRLFASASTFSDAISYLTLGNDDRGQSFYNRKGKGRISCKLPPSLIS